MTLTSMLFFTAFGIVILLCYFGFHLATGLHARYKSGTLRLDTEVFFSSLWLAVITFLVFSIFYFLLLYAGGMHR